MQRRGFPEPDRDFFAVAASLGMALLPDEKTMEDLSALLVECYPSRDECKLADGAADTVETFLVHHAHFVAKLVRAFKRPSMTHLKAAIIQTFEGISPGRVEAFRSMVQSSITYCRQVSKSMSSGAKTPNGVMRVVTMLRSNR